MQLSATDALGKRTNVNEPLALKPEFNIIATPLSTLTTIIKIKHLLNK